MAYSIQRIKKITGGKFINEKVFNCDIEQLLLDSRQLIFSEASLFFAIAGKRHDGHRFIGDLYERGIRNFLISKTIDPAAFPGANFIITQNSLRALQKLAAFHRSQFQLPLIGITGSNGKTTIKEWLFQLLHEDFHIVRNPKSYNSQVGVPLSLWQIRKEHDLGIFEAGISEMGEMQRLAPIINCTTGLFTNIGEAHSEGFPSVEEKIRQKVLLFQNAGLLIYCKDDKRVAVAIESLGKTLFSWSRREKADLQITEIKTFENEHSSIEGIFKGRSEKIAIPFADDASIENAVHCWAVLLHLGVKQKTIQKRMAQLEPVAMRLELKKGINNCTIINDSYNSDLNSLSIALNFLEQQPPNKAHCLILSDILQSAWKKESLYGRVAQLIGKKKISRFIAIGDAITSIAGNLPPEISTHFFPTTETFLEQLDTFQFRDEVILLKGARRFAFERIASRLSEKVHQTTLEINLSAITHNLQVFHQYLQPATKMMVMVKAAAYGSGSLEVARLLEFNKVDYLAVAYSHEGVELRRGGIRLPIMVLNSEEAVFENLYRYRLEPEIFSLGLLYNFARFISRQGATFPIHLKLDTGMHRLGFDRADMEELIATLKSNPQLEVRSVFSHLAASETEAEDDFTHAQIVQFEEMYRSISQALGYRPLRHILNSGGIIRFPQYQMDMVRLGIGMYGIDAGSRLEKQLRGALSLKAGISQIKHIPAGGSIGYNRAARAQKPLTIGTISIGYADGLLRAAGNGRYSVLVRGKRAPITGNVCMDMCMIDLSNIPEAREGDEITIFGEVPRIEELAQSLHTIPYEVLTNISPRVKRVYVQE